MMIKSSKLYRSCLTTPPCNTKAESRFSSMEWGSKASLKDLNPSEAEGNLCKPKVLRHSKTMINICFHFFTAETKGS